MNEYQGPGLACRGRAAEDILVREAIDPPRNVSPLLASFLK